MAINDFGEKIGGAKKDLWKERNMILDDLSEMNAAEKDKFIKKDNVWQKPDYAELVAGGLPIKVAYFIKTVRDSLGVKPVITVRDSSPEAIQDKQEKYIRFVGDIRDAVMNCKTEEDILRIGNRNWLVNNGYVEGGKSYYVRPTVAAGDIITNKFLRAFCITSYDLRKYDREIQRKQFLYNDEQKILAKYEFYKYENVTWKKDYNNRNMMELKMYGGSMFMYPQGEFADEGSWVPGSYFVMSGSRHNIVARNFESEEAAKKYILSIDSGKESEKPKRKGKTRFVPVQLEHIRREGDNVRRGRSMTGQDYLNMYDFKGGEFGNWMSEKDRQASLNLGYEALFDLAKALKIDFKDVSLGHSLSIAFGARGSGSALAHYEPLREVINLTKMRGAGSLAHEWAHALDDILGKRLGLGGFMTANLQHKDVPQSLKKLVDTMKYKEVISDASTAVRQKDFDDFAAQVRKTVNSLFPLETMSDVQIARKDSLMKSFFDNAAASSKKICEYMTNTVGNEDIEALSELKKEVCGTGFSRQECFTLAHAQTGLTCRAENFTTPIRVQTDFYANSLRFDREYSKTDHGYWRSNEEMFARAFACYVKDRVEGRSDYLCGHAELAAGKIKNPSNDEYELVKAFPVGAERDAINRCFDELFVELKEMGLLNHKKDFTVEQPREREEPVWDRLPETEEEAYPMDLFDLLADAYERSEKISSGEQMSFDLEKDF